MCVRRSLAVADSMPGDFAPTSAIIGGVLAQDMLNALGGREEPLCNWFTLDGLSGQLFSSLGSETNVPSRVSCGLSGDS